MDRVIAYRTLERITKLPGVRRLWLKFPFGSIIARTLFDIWERPQYAYGVYMAADLARRLNLPAISVIEFGVAGGRGLVELEKIAQQVGKYFGVRIAVFGFDSGEGMPEPMDYRDLPHVWAAGFYKMDAARLHEKIKTARLYLGDLLETIPTFLRNKTIAPIGFVAFDLDYYSSTRQAFRLFEDNSASRLPRVYCYFDETVWPEIACHNEYTGELCAIREFNLEHADKKICPIHRLRNMRIHPACWNDQTYVLHDFQHPLYGVYVNSLTDTTMAL